MPEYRNEVAALLTLLRQLSEEQQAGVLQLAAGAGLLCSAKKKRRCHSPSSSCTSLTDLRRNSIKSPRIDSGRER